MTKTFLFFPLSDSEPDGKANEALKSVAEEDAMRKMLTSDEDSDEDNSNKDASKSEDEANKTKPEGSPNGNEVKAVKIIQKKFQSKQSRMQTFYDAMNQGPGTGHASDFSSSDSDGSGHEKTAEKKKKKLVKVPRRSLSGSPVDASASATRKRKIENSDSSQSTPAKIMKADSAPAAFSSLSGPKDSTEEAVRRYLTRKPMTTTELLKKIQSKKSGVSSDELVDLMTKILRKINPSRGRIQGKMYLSLNAAEKE